MEEKKSTEETFAKKIFKGQKEAALFRAAEIGEASRDMFRDLRWKMRKRGGYCAFRALWRIGETGWTEDLFVSFGVKGRAALRLAEQYGYPFVTFKEGEVCEEYCALPLREQGEGVLRRRAAAGLPLAGGGCRPASAALRAAG